MKLRFYNKQNSRLKDFSISDWDEFQKPRRVSLQKLTFLCFRVIIYLFIFKILIYMFFFNSFDFNIISPFVFVRLWHHGRNDGVHDLINKRKAFG